MSPRLSSANFIIFAGVVLTLVTTAHAQVAACNGNQDLSGQYAFAANRLGWVQVAGVPPGTTATGLIWSSTGLRPPGTSAQFSSTPIGRLAFGALGAGPVSSIGRLLADGGGNLYAVPGLAPIGTYTVRPDCTVTLTLRDVTATVQAAANAAVTFRGVLQGRGETAVLVQTNPGGGTQLQLTRPFMVSGCSVMSLSGGFGLSAFGVQPGTISEEFTPPTVTPFALVARVFSDGGGNLVLDSGANNSPDSPSRYVGTYSINSECIGTMTLDRPSTDDDGPSNQPPSTRLRFVLTKSEGSNRPEILFVSDDSTRFSGVGTGR